MNKVVLIGRLVRDPELSFTPNKGTAVTKITLAVNRKNKIEGKQEADFIPVVIWGKQAEATANYTVKGKLIAVTGRMETRSYDAKDGTKKYITEVVAEEIQFLEWANNNSSKTPDYNEDVTPIDNDDDIPF